MINYMSNEKARIIVLTVKLMKKMLLYKRVILLNRIPVVKAKIKVELDLFSHVTYSELKA